MLEFELVLPCYNESKSIESIVRRAADAAAAARIGPDRFQLVLVENGSRDDSDRVMDELKNTSLGKWFRKVSVTHNQGYGYGIWSGLQTTTAPYVGWSHADQQCDPNDAFHALKMLRAAAEPNHTLVKGVRSGRDPKDQFVTWVFERIAKTLLGLRINEFNAQPKVFPRKLLETIEHPPFTFAFDLYVLYRAVKAGYRILVIPVLFPPRVHGVSNWAASFASRRRTIQGMVRYMWHLMRSEGRL